MTAEHRWRANWKAMAKLYRAEVISQRYAWEMLVLQHAALKHDSEQTQQEWHDWLFSLPPARHQSNLSAAKKAVESALAIAEKYKQAAARQNHEIEQILGKALDYPPLYPGASDVDDGQVCVGDHVAETLAAEAAKRIREMEGRITALEQVAGSEG